MPWPTVEEIAGCVSRDRQRRRGKIPAQKGPAPGVVQPGLQRGGARRSSGPQFPPRACVWELPASDAKLRLGPAPGSLDAHWCPLPTEDGWRQWVADDDGVAVRPPQRQRWPRRGWRVWCYCGQEMVLRVSSEAGFEDLYCHCGRLAERRPRPVGHVAWRCDACGASYGVLDAVTGEPRELAASPMCRALRYQGHALVDCLGGGDRAYGVVLPEGFSFSTAGVAASADAILRLRPVVVKVGKARARQSELAGQCDLLSLQDNDHGVATLREALVGLDRSSAEALLHGYAASGRALLIGTILGAGACDVDAPRARDGSTALHIAECCQQAGAAGVLRAYGANPTVRNKLGETPAEATQAAVLRRPSQSEAS